MEIKTVADAFVVIVAFLSTLIYFLKAIMLPVAPAAVLIALLIDHVFKRLKFWKDGWAGYASLGLNMLFSAGLYFASQAGQANAYLNVLTQLGVVFTLFISIVAGFVTAGVTHDYAVERGVGRSLTYDNSPYFANLSTTSFVDSDAITNDGPTKS